MSEKCQAMRDNAINVLNDIIDRHERKAIQLKALRDYLKKNGELPLDVDEALWAILCQHPRPW